MQSQQNLNSTQRLIHQMQSTINRHEQENAQLKQKLRRVTRQLNQIKSATQSDPLFNIFEVQNYSQLFDGINSFPSYKRQEEKVTIYHNKLQICKKRLIQSQRQNDQKNQLLRQKEMEIMSMGQKQTTLKRNNYQLINEVKFLRQNNQKLKTIIGKNEAKFQQMINKFVQLKEQIINNYQKTGDRVETAFLKIEKIRNLWESFTKKPIQQQIQLGQNWRNSEKAEEAIRRQSQLIEDMNRDLNQRNEEISKLRSNQQNYPPIINWDQFSIQQIIKFNQLRQKKYKDLLIKYEQMHRSLQSCQIEKKHLQKKYLQLNTKLQNIQSFKEKNWAFLEEIQKYQFRNSKLEQQAKFNEQVIKDILQENQVFHQMMFNNYGLKIFQFKIQEEVKKYRQRNSRRESKKVWANVEELIKMNKKLREQVMRAK